MEDFYIENNSNYNNMISLVDRLNVLKFIKPKTNEEIKKVNGEIKYITSLIQAEEFSSYNDYNVI